MTKENNIGGIWINKTRNGDKYLSGNIEVGGSKVAFVAFKNPHKSDDNKQPNYYILPKESKSQPKANSCQSCWEPIGNCKCEEDPPF